MRWRAIAAAVLLSALATQIAAAEGVERAYTTAHPGRADWLGLATLEGRYEIAPGPGCERIGPDMNVLLDRGGETWLIEAVDGDQLCSVAEWHWVGDLPCFTNDQGECNVEDA
jgi:hypothetical protein